MAKAGQIPRHLPKAKALGYKSSIVRIFIKNIGLQSLA